MAENDLDAWHNICIWYVWTKNISENKCAFDASIKLNTFEQRILPEKMCDLGLANDIIRVWLLIM